MRKTSPPSRPAARSAGHPAPRAARLRQGRRHPPARTPLPSANMVGIASMKTPTPWPKTVAKAFGRKAVAPLALGHFQDPNPRQTATPESDPRPCPPPPPPPPPTSLAGPRMRPLEEALRSDDRRGPRDRSGRPGPRLLRPRSRTRKPRLLPPHRPGHRGQRQVPPASPPPPATPPTRPAASATRPFGERPSTSAPTSPTPATACPDLTGPTGSTAANQLEESHRGHDPAAAPAIAAGCAPSIPAIILDDFTKAGAEYGHAREAGLAAALLLAREDMRHPRARRDRSGRRQGRGRHRPRCPRPAPRHLARVSTSTPDGDIKAATRLGRRWCRILGTDPDAAPARPAIEISFPPTCSTPSSRPSRRSTPPSPPTSPRRPAPPGTLHKRDHEKQAAVHRRPGGREHLRHQGPRAPRGHRHHAPPRARRPPPPAASPAPCASPPARRARTRVTVTSKVPPGHSAWARPSPRQAQRAAGAVPTDRRATCPAAHPQPPGPRLAPSGRHRLRHLRPRMRAFAGPVASAAWILARAGGAHHLRHHRHRLVRRRIPPDLARPVPPRSPTSPPAASTEFACRAGRRPRAAELDASPTPAPPAC